MISSTVACDISHIASQHSIRTSRSHLARDGAGITAHERNLLTNYQAKDISAYRFPVTRATSRWLR